MEKNINLNEGTSTSQNKKILKHMQEGYGITSLEALKFFGCLRLGARIADLKKAGHIILSNYVKVGEKRVKRYYMPNE